MPNGHIDPFGTFDMWNQQQQTPSGFNVGFQQNLAGANPFGSMMGMVFQLFPLMMLMNFFQMMANMGRGFER